MTYRNKRTGTVIKTFGKVSGDDWEPLEADMPVPDTSSEGKAEEAPAEKVKNPRRGKK